MPRRIECLIGGIIDIASSDLHLKGSVNDMVVQSLFPLHKRCRVVENTCLSFASATGEGIALGNDANTKR